ncbi:MAG TPA: helix-turn-helix transcriptional regulator [Rhizomicrobium sp.]|jgi:transcriptional regulator with XRE-family HTH domain|nr:helix-turn-helix transcriptional regulator [Rhizomicrobium sp.]
MDIRRQIGRNVRRIRQALEPQLSQEALALDAGIDRTYISGIERGIANPSALMLERIAKRLGVAVQDLVAAAASNEAAPKNLPRGRNVHHRGRKLGVKRRKKA